MASIVAKVARDRLMVEMDATIPGYGFAQHKGYGTDEHRAALLKLGRCPVSYTHLDVYKRQSPTCPAGPMPIRRPGRWDRSLSQTGLRESIPLS